MIAQLLRKVRIYSVQLLQRAMDQLVTVDRRERKYLLAETVLLRKGKTGFAEMGYLAEMVVQTLILIELAQTVDQRHLCRRLRREPQMLSRH